MATQLTRPARIAGGALSILLLSILGACCAEEPSPESAELKESAVPHFIVRGRLEAGPRLALRIDESDSPLPAGEFRQAVLDAIETWNATGLVQLSESQVGDEIGALLAWRRGRHAPCPAFGQDTSVAHAGPVATGSFIHFDADRQWSSGADASGLPLEQVVLHEIGHLLGLGHSYDEAAVMHANYDRRRSTPQNSDLAALASIYGGMEAGAGDVQLAGSERVLLHRAAPMDRTGVALWDVSGNGRDDLLVWRRDTEGFGRLMLHHFDEAGRVELSTGPLMGCVEPEAQILFAESSTGQGVLISVLESGRYLARRFVEGTLSPELWPPGEALDLGVGVLDAEGDGQLDGDWQSALPDSSRLVGDLNGDGELDTLTRR